MIRKRLVRGIGHAGLEQFIDSSVLFPSAVLSRNAGELNLGDLTSTGQILDVSIVEYMDLHRAFKTMQALGLSVEEDHSNFMYRPDHGFTIIDYETAKEHPQTLEEKVLRFAGEDMLLGRLRRGKRIPEPFAEYRNAAAYVRRGNGYCY